MHERPGRESPRRSSLARRPAGPNEEAACAACSGSRAVPSDPRKHRSISWRHQHATPNHQPSKFFSDLFPFPRHEEQEKPESL